MIQITRKRLILSIVAGVIIGHAFAASVLYLTGGASAQQQRVPYPPLGPPPVTTFLVSEDLPSIPNDGLPGIQINYPDDVDVGDKIFVPNLDIRHFRVTLVSHEIFANGGYAWRLIYAEALPTVEGSQNRER